MDPAGDVFPESMFGVKPVFATIHEGNRRFLGDATIPNVSEASCRSNDSRRRVDGRSDLVCYHEAGGQ